MCSSCQATHVVGLDQGRLGLLTFQPASTQERESMTIRERACVSRNKAKLIITISGTDVFRCPSVSMNRSVYSVSLSSSRMRASNCTIAFLFLRLSPVMIGQGRFCLSLSLPSHLRCLSNGTTTATWVEDVRFSHIETNECVPLRTAKSGMRDIVVVVAVVEHMSTLIRSFEGKAAA